MTKLAIVSPCYNEEEVLENSARRLTDLLDSLTASGEIGVDSFVLFVNDGSRDRTWQIIERLHAADNRIKGLNLARNVGHQNALMAGLMSARCRADIVVSVDADLQDDLDAIPRMIKLFKEGNDIVYGVKVKRDADPLMKRLSAVTFYKLQSGMGVECIYNHADFRLMSRRALDGITSFSVKPIYGIVWLGVVFIIISMLIGIYVLHALITGTAVPGWSSLILSIWFVGGMVLISIGVIGVYIGKIYKEVKNRPLYNIKETLD